MTSADPHEFDEAAVRLSPTRPVAAARMLLVDDVPFHGHAFHEITLVLDGSATHVAGGKARRLQQGDAVFVRAGGAHAYRDVRQLRVQNIYFCTKWLGSDFWPEGFGSDRLSRGHPDFPAAAVSIGHEDLTTFLAEVENFRCELDRPNPSRVMLRSMVAKLLVWFSRSEDLLDGPPWQTHEVQRVVQAIEHLASSGAPLDRRLLAASSGIAPDTLTRWVRRATGKLPREIYQDQRLRSACSLLLNSKLSVTEVAMNMGFADAPHFSKAFSARFGQSPSTYRAASRIAGPVH